MLCTAQQMFKINVVILYLLCHGMCSWMIVLWIGSSLPHRPLRTSVSFLTNELASNQVRTDQFECEAGNRGDEDDAIGSMIERGFGWRFSSELVQDKAKLKGQYCDWCVLRLLGC